MMEYDACKDEVTQEATVVLGEKSREVKYIKVCIQGIQETKPLH